MANNFFGNPAVIGAVTGVVAYFLLEEVLDDYVEDFVDMIKGKKNRNGGKNRGMRGPQQMMGGMGMPPPPMGMSPNVGVAYHASPYQQSQGWWNY